MSTTNTAPKDDEISRRIFYGGMFALPWLWIVHTLGWYSKQKVERDDEDDNREYHQKRQFSLQNAIPLSLTN